MALETDPAHADAMHYLGLLKQQTGDVPGAIDCLQRAASIKPDDLALQSNLGKMLQANGRLAEAITAFRKVVSLAPREPSGWLSLSIALRLAREPVEAAGAIRRALELRPQDATAWALLGGVLRDAGETRQAMDAYRQSLTLNPNQPEVCYNLGNALRAIGEVNPAILAYREAIRLKPDFAGAFNNLGNALKSRLDFADAIVALRRAVELDPKSAEIRYNLAVVLAEISELDESIAVSLQAIELDPRLAKAFNNLGNVYRASGLPDEAIKAYRQALELDPTSAATHSNLIFLLHFHPRSDATVIYEEATSFAGRHASPFDRPRLFENDPDPNRPLRIGYVSPDFKQHPLSSNFLPLAIAHDRSQYKMICYSNVIRTDEVTTRLRGLADEWHDVAGMDDDALAERIRQDRIDILVDLSVHMAGNRLLVFARKPAPVQATMLCSMGTTGLPMIDYRFSDRYSDPPEFDDPFYSEKTIRLPNCYFCHEPPPEQPEVNELPASSAGFITFGSLNAFTKVNPSVIQAWAEILSRVPKSRLILRCPRGSAQQRVFNAVAQKQVSASHVTFIDRQLPAGQYMGLHNQMDLYLDPFPYASHTTGFDALWMGVPFVTLAGKTDVGRSGVFLLSNVGLAELIAADLDQYLRKTIELASDLPRLSGYRKMLRERMRQSPLVDVPLFTRNVETEYRRMWRDWCQSNRR